MRRQQAQAKSFNFRGFAPPRRSRAIDLPILSDRLAIHRAASKSLEGVLMQPRIKRALLWGGAILLGSLVIAGAVFLCGRVLAPSPREWVVGIWEGEGEVQSQFSMKGPGKDIPPTWLPPLQSSIRGLAPALGLRAGCVVTALGDAEAA